MNTVGQAAISHSLTLWGAGKISLSDERVLSSKTFPRVSVPVSSSLCPCSCVLESLSLCLYTGVSMPCVSGCLCLCLTVSDFMFWGFCTTILGSLFPVSCSLNCVLGSLCPESWVSVPVPLYCAPCLRVSVPMSRSLCPHVQGSLYLYPGVPAPVSRGLCSLTCVLRLPSPSLCLGVSGT